MVRIEGSWHVGEEGPHRGGKDFHFVPCMLPTPPNLSPPPPAKGGETQQKARPRDGGVRGGLVWGGGAGERDWFQGWEQLGSRWGRGGGRCH